MTVIGADVLGDPTLTYRVGLIGSGIATSASPMLHEMEASALGLRPRFALLDLDELARGVEPIEVLTAILRETRESGWSGVTVTHPVKQMILPLLDDISPDGASIGAVNTVVYDGGRMIGHNTDWSGYLRSLQTRLPGGLTDDDLHTVVLLGAGGAGAAVGHALSNIGVENLLITDVDGVRAATLATRLTRDHPEQRIRAIGPELLSAHLSAATGLVNATPVGMTGHEGLPVTATALHHGLWVNDIVYRPRRTALLAAAEKAGCRTLGGGSMVALQAADGFALLSGLQPDPDRMLATFEQMHA